MRVRPHLGQDPVPATAAACTAASGGTAAFGWRGRERAGGCDGAAPRGNTGVVLIDRWVSPTRQPAARPRPPTEPWGACGPDVSGRGGGEEHADRDEDRRGDEKHQEELDPNLDLGRHR